MKRLALTMALTGALLLTGCSGLVSLNPFVTDEQSVMDPALLGMWTSDDGKDSYWVRQDGKGYRIRCLSDSNADDNYEFKARLMVADGARILDLVPAREDGFQLAIHTPVRVWTEGETVRVAFLTTAWLKEQASALLPTSPAADDRTLITAPAASVHAFFAKLSADPKAADKPDVLRRPR